MLTLGGLVVYARWKIVPCWSKIVRSSEQHLLQVLALKVNFLIRFHFYTSIDLIRNDSLVHSLSQLLTLKFEKMLKKISYKSCIHGSFRKLLFLCDNYLLLKTQIMYQVQDFTYGNLLNQYSTFFFLICIMSGWSIGIPGTQHSLLSCCITEAQKIEFPQYFFREGGRRGSHWLVRVSLDIGWEAVTDLGTG